MASQGSINKRIIIPDGRSNEGGEDEFLPIEENPQPPRPENPKPQTDTSQSIKPRGQEQDQQKKFGGFVVGFKEDEDGVTSMNIEEEYLDRSKMPGLCFPKPKILNTMFTTKKVKSPELNEFAGEFDVPADKKMFVFFGKPEEKGMVDCAPILGTNDANLVEYFEKYNVQELMEYLLSMVLLHTPEDPYQFISDYATQMLQCQKDESKFNNLPKLFAEEDVRAMYRLLDKQYRRSITLNQYQAGMESLSLSRYNPEPVGSWKNAISEETFCAEACEALVVQLRSFIEPD